MAFWDTVNDGLKKYAEKGWDVVRGSAITGKKRYDIHTLHKKAEKLFAEIGGIVYDMAHPPYENPLSRPDVLKIVEHIKRVEADIAFVEEEIAKIKNKEAADAAEEAQEERPGEAEETGKPGEPDK